MTADYALGGKPSPVRRFLSLDPLLCSRNKQEVLLQMKCNSQKKAKNKKIKEKEKSPDKENWKHVENILVFPQKIKPM